MIAVIYEDRPSVLIGVQLAALSLARHSPDLPILAITPNAPQSFIDWAARIPSLTVQPNRDGVEGESWNVKPSVLLKAFADGHDQALWFDSDMIVTADLKARLDAIDPDTVVATEEYFWGHQQGNPVRTTGLGLELARTFPATLNTCLLRVSRTHLPIVEQWRDILASETYLNALRQPATTRPLHLGSDLHVFTGLMGSTKFGDVPVTQLRRGTEIAQCYGPSGWTVAERFRSRKSMPLVLHAMGTKPWDRPSVAEAAGRPLRSRARVMYEAIHQDLTPYVAAAREYRGEFEGDDSWLTPATRTGAALTRMSDSVAMRELPLALVDTAQRRLRRRLNIGQMAG